MIFILFMMMSVIGYATESFDRDLDELSLSESSIRAISGGFVQKFYFLQDRVHGDILPFFKKMIKRGLEDLKCVPLCDDAEVCVGMFRKEDKDYCFVAQKGLHKAITRCVGNSFLDDFYTAVSELFHNNTLLKTAIILVVSEDITIGGDDFVAEDIIPKARFITGYYKVGQLKKAFDAH